MKINTKVRYGLKALAYIAENSSDKKLVRIKEISEDQDISIQYLEQILFKLKNEKDESTQYASLLYFLETELLINYKK